MHHQRARWQRWLALLGAGPLRSIATLLPSPAAEVVPALWREAVRESSARQLLDSVVNLAQARPARTLRDALVRDPGHLERGAEDPRLCDPEHFVTDGHTWHPMTRIRLGLRRGEVLRCAAEQLADTPLSCVEVELGLARVAGSWAEESARWFEAAPPGFVRVPIHPASPPRLRKIFPQLFERGAIRLVAGAPRPARSLLSLRTVAIAPTRHLELACPVHTTSTRRVVSPMSVHNGPQVSRLLAHIRGVDGEAARLVLMPEPAAAGLEPERVGARASELGAICRVAPPLAAPPLAAGEEAWVCAAIAERWPGREELVLERACAGDPGDRRERVEALVDAWLEHLAVPALRLFSRWGVALEVHTQNTLAVVAARRWAKLRRLVAACYARWQAEAGTHAQRRELAADLEALTRPRVRAKALLRMRMFERSSDYDYTEVDNALAAPPHEEA